MTKYTSKDIIALSLEHDGVNLKDALDDILSDKIADAVDSVSADIGAALFDAEAAETVVDEDFDEDLIEEVMDNLIEAADEEGIELSEEDLIELSKATLGSYAKKAGWDAVRKGYKAGKSQEHPYTKAYGKDRRSNSAQALRRMRGVRQAVDKLTREEVEDFDEDLIEEVVNNILNEAEVQGIELSEEDLMELSKKTLSSYIKKATDKPLVLKKRVQGLIRATGRRAGNHAAGQFGGYGRKDEETDLTEEESIIEEIINDILVSAEEAGIELTEEQVIALAEDVLSDLNEEEETDNEVV